MAYLVQLLSEHDVALVAKKLQESIERDGRFRLTAAPEVSGKTINMQKVRLTARKPYCGQHPGECVAIFPRPKRNSMCLEYDDWIAFHAVVNSTLDELGVSANVTTRPMETVRRFKGMGGKYWIRRGTKPRVRFDYDEEYNGMGLPVRWWNPGTPDQFEADNA